MLEVKDNGIGVPKYEINNVMKRFYKVDKSRVNNNSFGIFNIPLISNIPNIVYLAPTNKEEYLAMMEWGNR